MVSLLTETAFCVPTLVPEPNFRWHSFRVDGRNYMEAKLTAFENPEC